ncbi:MAG: TauD/TfdA family dioxygenase [Chloroflexota bacterium]
MATNTFHIDPLTPTIGAEIKGIDLSQPQSPETFEAIYQALIDHLVIFFRDQSLPPHAHVTFAESFGELDTPHPIYPHVDGYSRITLLENDGNRPPDTAEWHTDLTFKPTSAFAAILWAREVPPTGGDTLWSSLYAPYETLPPDMQQQLKGLSAIHDMGSFRNNFVTQENPEQALNEAMGRVVRQFIQWCGFTQSVSGPIYLSINPLPNTLLV